MVTRGLCTLFWGPNFPLLDGADFSAGMEGIGLRVSWASGNGDGEGAGSGFGQCAAPLCVFKS